MLEGKADKGTNKPERKRYGTNINLSRALDFSVQKQSEATKLWRRKAIVKAKWVDK